MADNTFRLVYANDVDCLIPELWANESIAILEEEMVMGGLVHRDFSNQVQRFGDIVHTRQPAEFVGLRKGDGAVTTQDVTATNVQVPLDQWVHVSFMIYDGEQTYAFKDLVNMYLRPAMIANARLLDQSLLAQSSQFLANSVGTLGGISDSTAHDYLVDTREKMNSNKAFQSGRSLVIASTSEAALLKTDLFISADKTADMGRAMAEAYLGRKFGFDIYLDLNTPSCSAATTATATTTDAAEAAGQTVLSVTATTAFAVGCYFTLAGDGQPLRCTAIDAGNTVTSSRALKAAVANGAAVQPYATGLVDYASGYASGYVGLIHVDGTAVPHVGQIVSFVDTSGTGLVRSGEYVITYVAASGSDYDIQLDRPLETALANNDVIGYGPNGDINFAFHRNAVTLVNRPLALPLAGTGARAATAVYNNMAMRAVITYDGENQGHRVTLDSLFGVKALDTDLGAVLLG